MRIREKLNLFVTLSSLAASAAVIGIVFLVGSNFLSERTEKAFQMQTYFTLRELDRLLFERIADVEVFSRTLFNHNQRQNYKNIEKVLYLLRDHTKVFQNLSYVDENFIKQVDTNRISVGEKVDWPILANAKNTREVVFDFYQDKTTQSQVISFAKHLISDSGVKAGYLVANVPFSTISRITRLSKENEHFRVNNRVELLRENGEIVYSSYRSEKLDKDLARKFQKEMGSGSEFIFLRSDNRLWSIGRARPFYLLGNLNWLLVMSANESEIYGPLRATILFLIGLLLAAGVVFSIIISRITKAMVRPVETASKAIEKFGLGELRALENLEIPEDELGILLRNLKNMGKQIQDLMTQKAQRARVAVLGEMAGNIAHEINNPLQVISIRLELIQKAIRQGLNLDKIEENIEIASQTVFRISKIVKGLKALSREGDADPFVPVTIQEIVDNVLVLCQGYLKNSLVTIDCSLQAPTIKIECRAVQITQVLLNLINNSFDAVKECPDRWIQLNVQVLGEEVEFRVRNSGPKVSTEVVEKIFDPFYTTKRAGQGTGLGLSISLKIAKEHNGGLFVDLNDSSTCFVFRIPKKATIINDTQI